jgi:hypothetical protein
MKLMLKLAVFLLATLGANNMAQAFRIDFCLFIDPNGPGTWELRASTDAPGGIASYAVDLMGINPTATRRGPRWNGPEAQFGFTAGQNNPQPQPTGGLQVFAGQNTASETLADDFATVVKPVVWGLGYDAHPFPGSGTATPVGPPGTTITHIGSTANPMQVPLLLHAGTYAIGASPAFHPTQPTNAGFPNPGAVWPTVGSTTPVGGANNALAPFYYCFPEPGAIVIFASAVPALALAVHRRRAAMRKKHPHSFHE